MVPVVISRVRYAACACPIVPTAYLLLTFSVAYQNATDNKTPNLPFLSSSHVLLVQKSIKSSFSIPMQPPSLCHTHMSTAPNTNLPISAPYDVSPDDITCDVWVPNSFMPSVFG